MHIPDHFLNTGASAGFIGAAVGALAYAVQKVRSAFLEKVPVLKARLATFPDIGGKLEVAFQNQLTKLGQEKIWRMAAVGALIFSAQMINFPIGGGTSGHLLGGVLAALILGPFEALLVMSAVLIVQAFMFGDGGVLALGVNIFNMGIIGALGGYGIFRIFRKWFLTSAFVAAWLSVILAATAASLETGISLPAMLVVHIPIGLGEGIITVLAILILWKAKIQIEAK